MAYRCCSRNQIRWAIYQMTRPKHRFRVSLSALAASRTSLPQAQEFRQAHLPRLRAQPDEGPVFRRLRKLVPERSRARQDRRVPAPMAAVRIASPHQGRTSNPQMAVEARDFRKAEKVHRAQQAFA